MDNGMSFEDFKNMLLYRRVTKWTENAITLDNGIEVSIVETEQDWCASAIGKFTDVKLDAAITEVTEPKYKPWRNEDTYGCEAVVKMLHNQNLVCKAEADANAGNGGYYYSIASFVVKMPNEVKTVHFVGSDDGEDEEPIVEEWHESKY